MGYVGPSWPVLKGTHVGSKLALSAKLAQDKSNLVPNWVKVASNLGLSWLKVRLAWLQVGSRDYIEACQAQRLPQLDASKITCADVMEGGRMGWAGNERKGRMDGRGGQWVGELEGGEEERNGRKGEGREEWEGREVR